MSLLKCSLTLSHFRRWLKLAGIQTFKTLLCFPLDIKWLQSLVVVSMHFGSRVAMKSFVEFKLRGTFELLNEFLSRFLD